MYELTFAQAHGQVVHQLLQTEFPKPLPQIEEEVVRAGRWEGELIHTRRDGSRLIVASRWALQRDGLGRPKAFLEINRDITERKHAEEELRRTYGETRATGAGTDRGAGTGQPCSPDTGCGANSCRGGTTRERGSPTFACGLDPATGVDRPARRSHLLVQPALVRLHGNDAGPDGGLGLADRPRPR